MLRFKTALLLLLSAFFIGMAYLFTKNGLSLFFPMQLLGFRFGAGLIFMGALIAARVIRLEKPSRASPLIAVQILISPLLYFALETFGLKRIDSSLAAIILAAAPIFSSFAGTVIVREAIALRQMLFALLAFSGICFLNIYHGIESGPGTTAGLALITAAAVCSGLSGSVTKRLLQSCSPFTLMFLSYLCAAVFFNIAGVMQWMAAGAGGSYLKPLSSPMGIVTVLYLSLLPGIACSLIQYYSLRRTKVSVVAMFSYLTPVISLTGASLFLHETITPVDISCILLIVGSMAGSVFYAGGKNIEEGNKR